MAAARASGGNGEGNGADTKEILELDDVGGTSATALDHRDIAASERTAGVTTED
jgi:hypothetical protein